jgi:hypothetical protein
MDSGGIGHTFAGEGAVRKTEAMTYAWYVTPLVALLACYALFLWARMQS